MTLTQSVPAPMLAEITKLYGLLPAGVSEQAMLRSNGKFFGYPECCIEAFVADCARGELPALMRGTTPGGWVPCPRCQRVSRWLSPA